ncbi:tyrosine recombinase XerC [Elysia marginata]|uniref:Tyrosine recombinase XerC n=1 Tax=Elysia marginata TaxID=1093978 RepID=A0AAV4H1E1_9GAST|nr:tyrosine recombinase XerC [Elysia marginata]
MTVKHSRIYFKISQLLKTSKPGNQVHNLVLWAYPVDRRLCPVLYTKEYLKCTKPLRQSDQFFVQCNQLYKGVSKDTIIRRWTKQVLQLSGINTQRYKPHSTGAASTSLAHSRQVPIDIILKSAGWKSTCTFARYYKRPLLSGAESKFSGAAQNAASTQ